MLLINFLLFQADYKEKDFFSIFQIILRFFFRYVNNDQKQGFRKYADKTADCPSDTRTIRQKCNIM